MKGGHDFIVLALLSNAWLENMTVTCVTNAGEHVKMRVTWEATSLCANMENLFDVRMTDVVGDYVVGDFSPRQTLVYWNYNCFCWSELV